METIVERPAALDVHKAQVTACARRPGVSGRREEQVETFATTVHGLLVLADWLDAQWSEPQPPGLARVLYHTIVWQYLPAATKTRIEALLHRLAATIGQACFEPGMVWRTQPVTQGAASSRRVSVE